MGFGETRLDESILDNDVEIENNTLYRKDRNLNGGGVVAYVKHSSGLISKIHNDLTCNKLELLTSEIKHTNCKPIIVMFGTMHVISTLFENVLQRVETENKDIVLIGDVNCDILNLCCYTK